MSDVNLFQAQLFLDDAWIAASALVGRAWHQARKRPEPALRGDEPWERECVVAYGTVLLHAGMFKIWYVVYDLPHSVVCYAESEDGIHWVKPRLGIHEFRGSKENNILFSVPGGYVDNLGVVDDPDDRKWPLKMIYWRRVWKKKHGLNCDGDEYGLCAARSADGVRWDHTPGLILPWWGDRTNVMPARDRGKYVIYGRHMPSIEKHGRTVVCRTESEDLVRWSRPEVALSPDLEDGPNLGFYSAAICRYESMYLGFIERMHVLPDVLDPEVCFSRDGRTWARSWPRRPLIARGEGDSWDSDWIAATSSAPIRHREDMLLFYSGRSHGHLCPNPRLKMAIGVAYLRPDGFCSLYASRKEGRVVTPPMRWPKADLLVNADPRRDLALPPRYCDGEVRVEVRDTQGRPVPGFSWDDCAPLVRNTAYRNPTERETERVQWKRGRRMASLAGRRIRLAFRLRDAHLFSFRAGQ